MLGLISDVCHECGSGNKYVYATSFVIPVADALSLRD